MRYLTMTDAMTLAASIRAHTPIQTPEDISALLHATRVVREVLDGRLGITNAKTAGAFNAIGEALVDAYVLTRADWDAITVFPATWNADASYVSGFKRARTTMAA